MNVGHCLGDEINLKLIGNCQNRSSGAKNEHMGRLLQYREWHHHYPCLNIHAWAKLHMDQAMRSRWPQRESHSAGGGTWRRWSPSSQRALALPWKNLSREVQVAECFIWSPHKCDLLEMRDMKAFRGQILSSSCVPYNPKFSTKLHIWIHSESFIRYWCRGHTSQRFWFI